VHCVRGRIITFAVIITILFITATHLNANLLTNGSFEQGTFVVNGGAATDILNLGSTSITGWTVSADQLAWIDTNNPWGLSAQDGNRFLDFTALLTGAPFGGISQTIPTTPGQQYNLSFYLGTYTQRWGGPPVSILAQAGTTSQNFTVSTPSTASSWFPFSMLFTATSASTNVTLTGSAGAAYIGLDNVSVDAATGSAVPEPSSTALVIPAIGFLAVALSAGKRRIKQVQ